ncbi:MAG: pyridoxal-phosphate dependent enzyme [Pseudomonadota bacterium]|nr:pyridoxal-phosphate dependent enzyme [Pseudomonadota bacterium]
MNYSVLNVAAPFWRSLSTYLPTNNIITNVSSVFRTAPLRFFSSASDMRSCEKNIDSNSFNDSVVNKSREYYVKNTHELRDLVAQAEINLSPFKDDIKSNTRLINITPFKSNFYFKMESETTVNSFKVRGALNAILSYKKMGLDFNHVVAMSAGNHSQGVALAAKLLNIKSTIVMPENTDESKIRKTKSFGADVIIRGKSVNESFNFAKKLSKNDDSIFIHPFDDPYVIAGQATIGREIIKDLPSVSRVIAPCGGGGLISGLGCSLPDEVEILGVQSSNNPSMVYSLKVEKRSTLPFNKSIAGGIAVTQPGHLTLEICKKLNIECLEVDENTIKDTILYFLENNVKIEGASAAALSLALIKPMNALNGNTVFVNTGSNISEEIIQSLKS